MSHRSSAPRGEVAARMRANEAADEMADIAASVDARLTPGQLQEAVGHSLTFEEMERALGGNAGLCRYDEAFPAGVDLRAELERWPWRALVFLFRSSPTYGHWLSVFEQKDGAAGGDYDQISIFDPYGVTRGGRPIVPDGWGPNSISAGMSQAALSRLGQGAPRLLEAVDRAGYRRVVYNEHQLQSRAPGVSTCGRHSLVRLALRDLSVAGYARALTDAARDAGLSTDELVTCLTTRV